jgi:hypothetical protein
MCLPGVLVATDEKRMEVKKNEKNRPTRRLLFYEKPLVGNTNRAKSSSSTPIQILHHPSLGGGGFGIALPLQQDRVDTNNTDSLYLRGDAMVISGPESSPEDDLSRRSLMYYFIFLALVNLIITIFLYANAHTADLSKVIPSSLAPNTFSFVQIPKERRYSEDLVFAITIINLLLGIIGAILQNPLLLFSYSLIALLIIFVGFPVVPYIFYSSRYLLDAINLYIAFALRNKLMMNILPFYFVRR